MYVCTYKNLLLYYNVFAKNKNSYVGNTIINYKQITYDIAKLDPT